MSTTPRNKTTDSGFSLLELLLALILFSVIFGALFQLLDATIMAETSSREDYQRTTEEELAWFIIRQDMLSIVRRPTRDSFGEMEPAFLLEPGAKLKFVRKVEHFDGSEKLVRLERVEYRFDDGNIYRFSSELLDIDARTELQKQLLFSDRTVFDIEVNDVHGELHKLWPPRDSNQTSEYTARVMPSLIHLRVEGENDQSEQLRSYPGLGQ